jgi:hypothetical protein
MYIISNFILIAYIFRDLMMYKYVITHQPNLVRLYALGRRVICTLVAIPFRRHILGAIGGRLIGTQHHKVALIGHLALPQIRPLAPPRCRYLALARLGQREPVILRLTIRSTWMGSKPGERSVRHSIPRGTDPLMTLSGSVLSHMTRWGDP